MGWKAVRDGWQAVENRHQASRQVDKQSKWVCRHLRGLRGSSKSVIGLRDGVSR